MKDPVVKGHPVHAILSDVPIGTTALGILFDLFGALTRSSQWSMAAGIAFGVALLSGCAAALAGWWDYQAVPQDHPAHRTGAVHGVLNATALLLLLLSLVCRWLALISPTAGAGKLIVGGILSFGAFLILAIAGWFGGELVFKLGWRVTPAEHAQLLEEDLQQHGQEEQIKRVHAIVEQYKQEQTLIP